MKLAVFAFLSIVLLSCTKSKSSTSANTCASTLSYANEVSPILIQNCTNAGCHDGQNMPSLADYNIVKDGAQQIKSAVDSAAMPRNGTLSAADKAAIICWIDQGALNN